jgi:hypothetical protein
MVTEARVLPNAQKETAWSHTPNSLQTQTPPDPTVTYLYF